MERLKQLATTEAMGETSAEAVDAAIPRSFLAPHVGEERAPVQVSGPLTLA